ncbi:MAG: CDP-glucose 4,6-dehydratase [Patescibacteria group bacterium]
MLQVHALHDFYKGKKVLITGHTGFKGGWLSLALIRLGARVSGISLDPPEKSFFNCVGIGTLLIDHRLDIRNADAIAGVIAAEQPDVIFHLAAQPLVRESYNEPLATFATNALGTAHVLEVIHSIESIRSVVCITTDKVYENVGDGRAYAETDRLSGHDPYSASKVCAEMVARAYHASYETLEREVGIATARAGNVIGGGDWACDRLVPDIIRSHFEGTPLVIRNPQASRPWQHVLEPLYGYMLLGRELYMRPKEFCGAWNFGPRDEDQCSVQEILTKIEYVLDVKMRYNVSSDLLRPEAHLLRLSSEKARMRLGWCPLLNLDQTIYMTSDWYRLQNTGQDMRKVSESQIETFFSAVTP